MLALWDGIDTGKDGGTSQIVQMALSGGKRNAQYIHHLLAPRKKNLFPVEQAPDLEKGEFIFSIEYNWRTLQSATTCSKNYSLVKWWRSNDSILLQFVVPIILLLFTTIGGYWRFKLHFTRPHPPDNIAKSLNNWGYFYKALNLTTLNSSVIDHSPD